jgi:hypothetical protein
LLVAHRMLRRIHFCEAMRAFLPWAAVSLALFASSVWLMLQPMEMRAMLMSG